MQPAGGNRYRVIRSDAFRSAWNEGMEAGWIDPEEHGPSLEFYANVILQRIPFAGRAVFGAAANVLVIRFPRSPRALTCIEIFYSNHR